MSKDEYLITDAPLKALTVFAMPLILGSFFQQVYNMTDLIIVGQFVGSSFLGKDGTALAYQVSGDYMKWIGYFFVFMGIKMTTDGVLRGFGIMRPFLLANIVNLAIRLSVALIFAPHWGIAFVWLTVPAGWLANFLISYVVLRKSWSKDGMYQ
jgi:hypothetical protein